MYNYYSKREKQKLFFHYLAKTDIKIKKHAKKYSMSFYVINLSRFSQCCRIVPCEWERTRCSRLIISPLTLHQLFVAWLLNRT